MKEAKGTIGRKAAVAVCVLFLCVAAVCVALLPSRASVSRAEGESVVAELYADSGSGKTKVDGYATVNGAVDAAVADNLAQSEAGKVKYTVEVLADCDFVGNYAAYTGGDIRANQADLLVYGGIDLTINGNGHVATASKTTSKRRGFLVRDSRVVVNDWTIINYSSEMCACIETRGGGDIYLELNRVILQIGKLERGGNSAPLKFGGDGYKTKDGKDAVLNVKAVVNDSSIGNPIAGRKVNGKEVEQYFTGDRYTGSNYGILSYVQIDLTLDNTAASGFAALYMKCSDYSTGSRNSVIRIENDSYLQGYNPNATENNNFGAVVLEKSYSREMNYTDNEIYYDYDNDGFIDYKGGPYKNETLLDDLGNLVDIAADYDKTSNITVEVKDSTIESTSADPDKPANQYCFLVQTSENTVSVSGNSALVTDDEHFDAPTKAIIEYAYGTNDISVTGGRLFKWYELPVAYINSDVAVGDMLYATFADAMAHTADGDTVSLIRDVTVDTGSTVAGAGCSAGAYVESGKGITVDLNGKTLSVDSSAAALALLVNDGELTLTNGTVERTYDSAAFTTIVNRGQLQLSDLYIIDRTPTGDALIVNGGAAARSAGAASLTVASGTYVSVGGNVVENLGGTVTVSGGTLESRAGQAAALVGIGDIRIDGGTLKGYNALVVRKADGAVTTEIGGGVFKGGLVLDGSVSVKGGTFDTAVKEIVLPHVVENYHISDVGSVVTVTQFLARSDLAYTGKEYAVGVELNALLRDESVKITDEMTVKMTKYVDADGNDVTPLPAVVKSAGTYSFIIGLPDGTEATIDITVARKRVSVQDIDFSVVKIGDTQCDVALESITLYKSADGDYSTVRSNGAETVEAICSVVRERTEAVTLGLTVGVDGDAYAVTVDNNVFTVAGSYLTTATLTVKSDYVLFYDDTDELLRRGIVIIDSGNGMYRVVKTWYIVNMKHWFVDENGRDYAPAAGHVFGQTPDVPVPWLNTGDVPGADQAPVFDDKITVTLWYNGTVVAEDFRRYRFDTYFNDSMPVGKYEFEIVAADILTGKYSYEVYPAAVDKTAADGFLAALQGEDGAGNTFTVEWDGYMHLFDESTAIKLRALKQAILSATPERKGVWLDNAYDQYFGGFTVAYNLDRLHSEQYYEENALAGFSVRPDAPGLYTVYYTVSAANFEPIIALDPDDADYTALRRRYVFNVVIVRGVEIPAVSSVVYNGSAQKADIVGNEFYTVDRYDGFTDAAVHGVTLRLRAPEYYYWVGHTLGESAVTVDFEIRKGANEWIEAPDIVRWVEGKYDAEDNRFIGAAKFGTIVYVVTDDKGNVVFDSGNNINNLAKLKAGTYRLQATVVGNDNYNGLNEAFFITVLKKVGLPWWGTLLITLGALLLAALIIFILWKKGVFRFLTDKIVLAIRTKATVDATIAAIRANKRAEEAKLTIARAKAKEANEARRAAAAAERAKPAEERAMALEEKAKQAEARAQRIAARAEAMRARAESMRARAVDNEKAIDEKVAEVAASQNEEE